MKLPRIFVSVAAYRDPETPHTLQDLFAKARHPQRIFVGVLWQVVPGEDDDCLQVPAAVAHRQLQGIHIHPSQSRGACWARSKILTELRRGEEFVLQIDSHMRFVQDWDEKMLTMLQHCATPRALLSTYPITYTPPATLAEPSIPLMTANKFNHRGLLMPLARTLSYDQRPAQPVPNPFISAGFLFGPAAAFDQVPYDPHLYFIGEEISLAVRLWTHGWDVYSPNDVLIYHFYGPPEQRPRHWTDNSQWGELDNISGSRLRHLFGMEPSTDPNVLIDIDRYGLGSVRTLEEFERYADVNLRQQTTGAAGRCGRFPLHPLAEDDALRRVFERIYRDDVWQSIETRSGLSATLQATAEIRPALAELFKKLNIRTLLDAGCGDVNWMQSLTHELDLYLGLDIVAPLVAQNLRLFSHRKGHFFSVANIATDPLPAVDAILCRNVLNLLPHEIGLKIISNMLSSPVKVLMISSQKCSINQNGLAGVSRPLNLTQPPFCLPEPDLLIADGAFASLSVWIKNCT